MDVVYDNFGRKGTADKAMHAIRSGGVFMILMGGNGGQPDQAKDQSADAPQPDHDSNAKPSEADSGLVETPESKPKPKRQPRRKPKPKVEGDQPAGDGEQPEAAE